MTHRYKAVPRRVSRSDCRPVIVHLGTASPEEHTPRQTRTILSRAGLSTGAQLFKTKPRPSSQAYLCSTRSWRIRTCYPLGCPSRSSRPPVSDLPSPAPFSRGAQRPLNDDTRPRAQPNPAPGGRPGPPRLRHPAHRPAPRRPLTSRCCLPRACVCHSSSLFTGALHSVHTRCPRLLYVAAAVKES